VVENATGSGGNIAVERAVKAAPDGHTLVMASNAIAITPSLYPALPYNAVRDLAPISLAVIMPVVLVTQHLGGAGAGAGRQAACAGGHIAAAGGADAQRPDHGGGGHPRRRRRRVVVCSASTIRKLLKPKIASGSLVAGLDFRRCRQLLARSAHFRSDLNVFGKETHGISSAGICLSRIDQISFVVLEQCREHVITRSLLFISRRQPWPRNAADENIRREARRK
jgi:hypothetical protein